MIFGTYSDLEILVMRDMEELGFDPHNSYSVEMYWEYKLGEYEDDRDLQSGWVSVLQDGSGAAEAEEH
jgi:hypothetical protein